MKTRLILGVLLLCVGTETAFANPLKGTNDKVRRAYRVAVEHDYTFLRSTKQVRKFVKLGLLVRVKENRHLRLHDVGHPFARPAVALFVRRLSEQYKGACGKRLVVTSLVRPKSRQPHNASQRSVHPTGMAIDLRIPEGDCRAWLEENLITLQDHKVALVTRERNPAHYHVVLFPNQYLAYLKERGVEVK